MVGARAVTLPKVCDGEELVLLKYSEMGVEARRALWNVFSTHACDSLRARAVLFRARRRSQTWVCRP